MTIFTDEAKQEIKRYLPHYIVGSGFLIASIFVANLCTNAFNFNLDRQRNMPIPIQQEANQAPPEDFGPLPSEIEIGLPYTEAIKDTSKPLLVEFYADWCPHSRRLTPIVAEVSEEFDGVNYATINTQIADNYYLSKKYKVDKFPFLVLINTKDGTFKEVLLKDGSFTKEGLIQQLKEATK